ncbi:MAG TPA: thioeseterase [Rhodobacteraceae bacterium]|nr:thioeseterase [Paracoccaceae bacterium]
MYPVVRMGKELALHARAETLPVWGTHVSRHTCWPWDLDLWMELNNGRTLTLFDLGRLPLGHRTGMMKALRGNRWGITVAGVSVRYRARIRAFDRVEMRSRGVGHDGRFFYIEQTIWRGQTCTTQALIRNAITSKAGIVPPKRLLETMGQDPVSPELPDWVAAWIAAEEARSWPPAL